VVTQSVRHAARRLVRARSFAAAAVLTLAGGLGATTTVVSIVHAVLLRPLPYAAPDRLVSLSHTLGVAGLTSMFAALCVSGLPALRSSASSLSPSPTWSSRSATAGRERHRARQALVAAQVALALVLLVGSGLMARSVWRLRSVQPGFDPANALSFRIAVPPATYPGGDEPVRFFVRVEDGIGTIPGVQATGTISKLPLDDQGRIDSAVFVEDRPVPAGSLPGIHPVS
jgi:putative ABC transport system permease protein